MNEFENLFGGMTDLSKSLNYQYSCRVLKDLWFSAMKGEEVLYENQMQFVRMFALKHLIKHGGFRDIPKEYLEAKIYLVEGKDGVGAVIEVPNAKYECECNRVAMILENDLKRRYYTSEYYAISKDFGFCEFTKEGHLSYSQRPATLEEFLDCIKMTIIED